MRILFMSGVDVGGAPKSTVELARRLAERGHTVGIVLGRTGETSSVYGHVLNASIKFRAMVGVNCLRPLLRPFGARISKDAVAGHDVVPLWRARRPENALQKLLSVFSPDIVVVNSFPREQMRWIHQDLHRAKIPMGVYLREEHAVTHFTVSGLNPDLVLANSKHLADAVRATGRECMFAPSIIDVSAATVESARRTVLLVNPVTENRPEILRAVAARRPDIICVLQESWPLPAEDRTRLEKWVRAHENLELRSPVPIPADVYRDARILVATYSTGRPRVVAEAQHNGIPVVGFDQSALVEAIGDGGILVHEGATETEWVETITRLWDDKDRYTALSGRARTHAAREEIDPAAITSKVEQALSGVVSEYSRT